MRECRATKCLLRSRPVFHGWTGLPCPCLMGGGNRFGSGEDIPTGGVRHLPTGGVYRALNGTGLPCRWTATGPALVGYK